MSTDTVLIQQTKQGNGQAFEQLFHKYRPIVYALCLSMTKNAQDAEELTQDVFVLAYQKIDQLKSSEKFLAWLKSIAQNRSKSFLRSQLYQLIPLEECSDQLIVEASPEEKMLKGELADAITQAIKALPHQERRVLQAFLDGFSHKEISQQFGIALQTSMNRLYQARKRIVVSLKDSPHGIALLPKALLTAKIRIERRVYQMDAIQIQIGEELIPLVKIEEDGSLLQEIQQMREALTPNIGFPFPAVRIIDNLDLSPKSYKILIFGKQVAQGELEANNDLGEFSALFTESLKKHREKLITQQD